MTTPARKPLTADRYITWLRRSHAAESAQLAAAIDKATAGFRKRRNEQRCEKLAELDDTERPAAVAMATALGLVIDMPFHAPPGEDVPAMTLPEIDEALDAAGVPPFVPPTTTESGSLPTVHVIAYGDSATHPSASDAAPPSAEVPEPRGVAPYVPGPAAVAALGRKR